jgi:hypothetical protein
MTDHRDEIGQKSFPFGEPVEASEKPGAKGGPDSRSPLPEGWRQLPLGLRGSRLYLVMRPDGTARYWEGEMPLNGVRYRRRFASELQARAWLHLAAQPRFTLGVDALEETHGSFHVDA